MNYIYKDKNAKKCIGEISSLTITPFFAFEITADKQIISCYLDHLLSEWHICIVNYEIDVELAHPIDIYSEYKCNLEKQKMKS